MQALANGTLLPPGVVLTKNGGPPLIRPRQKFYCRSAAERVPGSLMFEMQASVLAAAPIHALTLGQQKRRRFTRNGAILAIDVSIFRPLADFIGDADALAAIIKALPRQKGLDEILLPGERSSRTEAVRRKCGIPIPAKLREELEEIAKAHTISMPTISPSAAASPPKSSKPQPASAQSADRPAHGRQAIAPTGRCARCGRARARARSASATARCRRAARPE